MPTREQTMADAVQVFENAEYPSRLSAATAWLGIYHTLLWYEPVTNEYDPSRLNKMLDDTCVDGVVHVHKAVVVQVCRLDGRLTRLIDLADFINATSSW